MSKATDKIHVLLHQLEDLAIVRDRQRRELAATEARIAQIHDEAGQLCDAANVLQRNARAERTRPAAMPQTPATEANVAYSSLRQDLEHRAEAQGLHLAVGDRGRGRYVLERGQERLGRYNTLAEVQTALQELAA